MGDTVTGGGAFSAVPAEKARYGRIPISYYTGVIFERKNRRATIRVV